MEEEVKFEDLKIGTIAARATNGHEALFLPSCYYLIYKGGANRHVNSRISYSVNYLTINRTTWLDKNRIPKYTNLRHCKLIEVLWQS